MIELAAGKRPGAAEVNVADGAGQGIGGMVGMRVVVELC